MVGGLVHTRNTTVRTHHNSLYTLPSLQNLACLVVLQGRTKRLQGVCEGRYQASSTSETVAAALQSQMECVHAASTILHHVCEEFPQHQGALCRLSLALAAHSHTLEREEQETS